MKRKIFVLFTVLAVAAATAAVGMKMDRLPGARSADMNDLQSDPKNPVSWIGEQGTTFDKSPNGYGWYQGYNRKVQTNIDPEDGITMVGSVYRRLAETGSGTIGGMVGAWDGSFSGYAQTIYGYSAYQNGTVGGAPGGRYPQTSAFINGYLFGLFNDYDIVVGPEVSQAMFVVADATWGWDESEWSAPKRIEATEGGATPQGAWTGVGDVAYNPDDGYYYWTSNWAEGLAFDTRYALVTGRSQTPADPESWEWTDHNEHNIDTTTPNGITDMAGKWHISYAKDIYGNGTGHAIAVAMIQDETNILYDLEGVQIDASPFIRLGYIYTTNWGADWSSGDFKSNWQFPNEEKDNFFIADINKKFDWYNSEIEIEEGVFIPLNIPYFQWNISAVATENNKVHVLVKMMAGASTESDYIFFTNEEKVIGGFYDVVGDITETGVKWHTVNYVSSFMGIDDGNLEWMYTNTHDLGIGYAGHGVVYATWIDRPESRYTENPFADGNKIYICDSYFTYSPDDGRTWDVNKTVTFTEGETTFELKYAANITKTGNLQDEGFQVSSNGLNKDGTMTVYAACQYFDPENPLDPPVADYYDHQQFMTVWKITGTPTGIEMEQASLTKDFTLYQNYPNPFNPTTEIKFALQNDSDVKLSVFNLKGEKVAELKNEKMSKGVHAVNFDATTLNSGVYFYRLNAGGRSETKKMMLIK